MANRWIFQRFSGFSDRDQVSGPRPLGLVARCACDRRVAALAVFGLRIVSGLLRSGFKSLIEARAGGISRFSLPISLSFGCCLTFNTQPIHTHNTRTFYTLYVQHPYISSV